MLGALIGAGASIIGSIFGSKKEKPQETTTRINYKQMVADAEAAGFNPLTALRAGGGAGFTTTTHPALTGFNPVGSALQTVGAALANYDPQANARADLETKLLNAQLINIQADTKNRMRSFEVPVRVGATAVNANGDPIRSAAAQSPTGLGAVAVPEIGEVKLTNPHKRLVRNPNSVDAAAYEEAYGEIGGNFFGALNIAETMVYNFQRDWDKTMKSRRNHTLQEALDFKARRHNTWIPNWVPEVSWKK